MRKIFFILFLIITITGCGKGRYAFVKSLPKKQFTGFETKKTIKMLNQFKPEVERIRRRFQRTFQKIFHDHRLRAVPDRTGLSFYVKTGSKNRARYIHCTLHTLGIEYTFFYPVHDPQTVKRIQKTISLVFNLS